MNPNALAISLGLESIKYEPEQFAGLIYRPTGGKSVVLLFTPSRVVITGSPDLDTAEETFTALRDEVTDLLAGLRDRSRDFDEKRFFGEGLRDTSDYTSTRRAPTSLDETTN